MVIISSEFILLLAFSSCKIILKSVYKKLKINKNKDKIIIRIFYEEENIYKTEIHL